MPLFKKNKQHDATAPAETTNQHGNTAQQLSSNVGPHEPLGLNSRGNQPTNEGYPGYNRGYAPETAQGAGYGTGHHGYQTGMNESYPSGMGTGTGTGTGTGAGGGLHGGQHGTVPPTGTLNNQNQTRGGEGQRMMGKMESAVGSMVGSETLKVRGLQKEQEASAFRVQGDELAEAERLEREAMARRERAVGHGAHPANRDLGAGMRSQYP